MSPATDGRVARVDLQYDFSGSRRYDVAGRLIEEEKPRVGRLVTVRLIRVRGAWKVAEVG